MNKKITIYTKAYNTKPYLRQCIESVLSQSYPDFEYLLVDNGCTDGSGEIMSEYAMADDRIHLIRYVQNQKINIQEFLVEYASGEYLAVLDSDDWWDTDYLERLLFWSEKNKLDVACTGTVMHVLESGEQYLRKVNSPIVFSRETLAEGLPLYHVFFRTLWGKLIRMQCICAVSGDAVPKFSYGRDTAWCFQLLRQTRKIGVDSSVLHHYRIHEKSVSYQYDPSRFDADMYLYEDAIKFLSSFGPVSSENRKFLQAVYANAVFDTIYVILNSTMSPAEKLRQYRTIATASITLAAYQSNIEDGRRSQENLIICAMTTGSALKDEDDRDFRLVMQTLLPRCGRAVSGENVQLFLDNSSLLHALLQDNIDVLMKELLGRMENQQGVKRYAIPRTIQALAADSPLLCQIDNAVFLRKYAGIYWEVWKGHYIAALDEMTGLLLENKVSGGRELFLTLFISLAAMEEQVPAFIFGKMQLAEHYLRQGRREQARAVVSDLTEMGVEDAELETLRRRSQKQ